MVLPLYVEKHSITYGMQIIWSVLFKRTKTQFLQIAIPTVECNLNSFFAYQTNQILAFYLKHPI